MKIENVAKTGVFEKHPCFWAKNGETCVFGLKTATKKRQYEPKIVQKSPKRAQIDMFLRVNEPKKNV